MSRSVTAFPSLILPDIFHRLSMYLESQVTGPCIVHSANKASFKEIGSWTIRDLLLYPDIPRYIFLYLSYVIVLVLCTEFMYLCTP